MSDLFLTLWLQGNMFHYLTKEMCLPFMYKNWNEMRSNEKKDLGFISLSLLGTLDKVNKLLLCKP